MSDDGQSRGAGLYYATILGSTVLMGSSFVASKMLLRDVPPVALAASRFFVAALATLPVLWLMGRVRLRGWRATWAEVRATAWLRLILIGSLQTAMVMSLLFIGLQYLTPAKAAILMATNPILVAALGRLLLGEALRRTGQIGLLIGIAGVICCVGVDALVSRNVNRGDLIVLGGSLAWACATIVNKRARLELSPWAVNFWQMLFGAAMLAVLAAALGQSWPAELPPAGWGWFLWLAVPASTGSFGLWFAALRLGGAVRTSGFLFLVPFFAAVLSSIVLGEHLAIAQAVGGVLIAVGVYLVNR
jgi:drug/metabolite transporter (DMT)-like permease